MFTDRTETEINGAIVARIRSLVGYGMTVEEVVGTIPTDAAPARWVRFVAAQCVREYAGAR